MKVIIIDTICNWLAMKRRSHSSIRIYRIYKTILERNCKIISFVKVILPSTFVSWVMFPTSN